MREFQDSPRSMEEILHPGSDADAIEANFPNAPHDWRSETAIDLAAAESISLSVEHWQAIQALQEYYARRQGGRINARELHDALDEKFHQKGGIRYLYELFPAGPVAQGCRFAGLKPPAGAIDTGFGSAV